MQFLEKDLEDIIFNTPNHFLIKRGLRIKGTKRRQFRIGNYGVADIVTFQRPEYDSDWKAHLPACITVYELKNGVIDENALMQAARYMKGIKSYFLKRDLSFDITYKINLIGSSVKLSNDFIYLEDFIEGLSIKTFKYDFDGIWFKNETNYCLPNEGF